MKSHQHSSHIGAMTTKDVKAKEVIVSLSLIADVSKIPTDWVVPKQFLLGLGSQIHGNTRLQVTFAVCSSCTSHGFVT